MELSQIGEFGLIERLSKIIGKPNGKVIVGVGDDCAVIQITNNKSQKTNNSKAQNSKHIKYQLITTDTLIENVHFRIKNTSLFDLGYKALAVNISDIAAMGGLPTYAVVTIGAPKNFAVEKIEKLYRGLKNLAKKQKIQIVGGDTVSSPKALIISITLLGEVEKEYLLTRAGAKPGDLICVTGEFGGPASKNFQCQMSNVKLRFNESRNIAKARAATSMIDSSDGLVRSVLEICRASRVGARIWENSVPKAKGVSLDNALYGGEEYELVFTVPKGKADKLRVKKNVVGEITAKKSGVKLVDKHGKIKELKSGGFEHFHDQ